MGKRQTGSSNPINARRGFHRNGIRFDKVNFHQRKEFAMDGASLVKFAAQTVAAQLRHFRAEFRSRRRK